MAAEAMDGAQLPIDPVLAKRETERDRAVPCS